MKRVWICYSLIVAIVVLCAAIVCADSITGILRVTPGLTHTGTGSASTLTEKLDTIQTWTISGTTNAASLTKMFVQSFTLTGAAGTNFDLHSSLNDSFGQAVSFDTVKFFAVIAGSNNLDSVGVGGAATNPMTNWVADASDIIKVRPNSSFYMFAPDTTGYAVTNGVADTIGVTNYHATSNATVDIYVIGIGQ